MVRLLVLCEVVNEILNMIKINIILSAPWMRWLVSGCLPRNPGFEKCGIFIRKWAKGLFFLMLRASLSVLIRRTIGSKMESF
jgi:hypothetical protein